MAKRNNPARYSVGHPDAVPYLAGTIHFATGGLGTSQMGAVTVAFPLGQIIVGLGLLFGNGAAAYLSRLLGRGDLKKQTRWPALRCTAALCLGQFSFSAQSFS